MGYTFHTVFNQELERIPILIHIKVPRMNLRNYMSNVTCHIKLLTLLQLKYDLLKMIIAIQYGHDYQWPPRALLLLSHALILKQQYLLDEVRCGKLDLARLKRHLCLLKSESWKPLGG